MNQLLICLLIDGILRFRPRANFDKDREVRMNQIILGIYFVSPFVFTKFIV